MLFFRRYKTDFESIEEDILPRYSHIYSGDTAKYVHSITNKTRQNIRNDTFRREGTEKRARVRVEEGENVRERKRSACVFTMSPTIFLKIWVHPNYRHKFSNFNPFS